MKNETDLQVLVDLNYKDNPNQNKPINPQKTKTTQDILNHLVLAQLVFCKECLVVINSKTIQLLQILLCFALLSAF